MFREGLVPECYVSFLYLLKSAVFFPTCGFNWGKSYFAMFCLYLIRNLFINFATRTYFLFISKCSSIKLFLF